MIFLRNDVMSYLGEHLIESQCTKNENVQYDSAVFDSRESMPDIIFIAIDGEKSAGIKYVNDAISRGAKCVVSNINYRDSLADTTNEFQDTVDFFFVDDSLYAFGLLGKLARDQYEGNVIGVIGSVGKTTTKNMLLELGGGRGVSHASRGSYNNQTGVPLTLCALPKNAKRAIVELGESHFGDLTYISEISRPSHLVITNVALAHIEFLGDTKGVAKTMNETVSLMSDSGSIVVPIDTEHLETVLGETKTSIVFIDDKTEQPKNNSFDVSKYPNSKIATIKKVTPRPDLTHDVEISFDGNEIKFHIPLIGKHFVIDGALAVVASLLCGDDISTVGLLLENVVPQGHRMRIVETPMMTIIDDCYNANPASMKASMDAVLALAKEKNSRSVFVMGPMRELGINSDRFHRELGQYADEIGIDVLVCVDEATKTAGEQGVHRDSYYFETVAIACEKIESIVKKGDIVGVKASRGPDPDQPAMVPVVEILTGLK